MVKDSRKQDAQRVCAYCGKRESKAKDAFVACTECCTVRYCGKSVYLITRGGNLLQVKHLY